MNAFMYVLVGSERSLQPLQRIERNIKFGRHFTTTRAQIRSLHSMPIDIAFRLPHSSDI